MKAEEKDLPAVLRLLDFHLASSTRPDQVARRLKGKGGPPDVVNQNYYQIYTSKNQSVRSTSIDFPTANPYFDYGSIYVLRDAFEVFRKADLTSDLIARFKDRAARAPDDAKLIPTLAASYLLWWNDDKDEALREYNRATDLARNDVELKLSLAELRAQRGEPLEALEAADSVEPLDQKTMQRREMLALRLSVLGGDVNRARKASERLFGLRLDAETQVQLATQMNQLGMLDLAEAVLARARRRSGGQQHGAGLPDAPVPEAGQGRRRRAGGQPDPPPDQRRPGRPGQPQRGQHRRPGPGRGRAGLRPVGQAEGTDRPGRGQLETSPTSQQLLQTLVDYYQADGQRDKVKATYERIARLRPDDAKLRMQVAAQLSQAGAAAESLDHYRAALKKDPSLFAAQYSSIQRAFQQAGKADELVKLYEAMDFKSFQSNPYIITNTIQNLMQTPKTRDQGMALLRKAWKDMPDSRPTLLSTLYDESVWKLPEIYDYAREAIIPRPGKPIVNAWAGLDSVTIWGGNNEINNTATQLIDAAGRQGKLDALADEMAEAARPLARLAGGQGHPRHPERAPGAGRRGPGRLRAAGQKRRLDPDVCPAGRGPGARQRSRPSATSSSRSSRPPWSTTPRR